MLFHSTKYDGSLHYRYQTTLVHQEDNLLVLYRPPGIPVESYRGRRDSILHALLFFWSDRHYNLQVLWDANWEPSSHYINIATPATWDDGTLRFIDLDLDIIWWARSGEVRLDDEEEFIEHQKTYSYPQELVDTCWQTCDEVRALLDKSVPPFDGAQYAWRPPGVKRPKESSW